MLHHEICHVYWGHALDIMQLEGSTKFSLLTLEKYISELFFLIKLVETRLVPRNEWKITNKYIYWHLHSLEPFTRLFGEAGRVEHHRHNKEGRETARLSKGLGLLPLIDWAPVSSEAMSSASSPYSICKLRIVGKWPCGPKQSATLSGASALLSDAFGGFTALLGLTSCREQITASCLFLQR